MSLERKSKKVTEVYLERAALHYLERFSTTEANLRAVLSRKVRRRNEDHTAPTVEQSVWIHNVAEKCVRLGYVDDKQYATQRAAGLQRKGKPLRFIKQDLRHKGVSDDLVQSVLTSIASECDVDPDRVAAVAYVRRRRFGAFRRTDHQSSEKLEKEKAAMVRAGFPYPLVDEVLSANEDELMELLP